VENDEIQRYVSPLEGRTNMRWSKRGCLTGYFEADVHGNNTVRGLQFALNRAMDGTLSVRTPDAIRMFFIDGSQSISYRDGRQSIRFDAPKPLKCHGLLYRYPDGSQLRLPKIDLTNPEVFIGVPYRDGKGYLINIKTEEHSVICIASSDLPTLLDS